MNEPKGTDQTRATAMLLGLFGGLGLFAGVLVTLDPASRWQGLMLTGWALCVGAAAAGVWRKRKWGAALGAAALLPLTVMSLVTDPNVIAAVIFGGMTLVTLLQWRSLR